MTSTLHAEHTRRVEVSGALDLEGGDRVEAQVSPHLTSGARVTIGLAGVTFADSSGLGALIALSETAADNDAELVLAAPSAAVRRVLEITGITDQFRITP
jgi:anti-anti-sigma factor